MDSPRLLPLLLLLFLLPLISAEIKRTKIKDDSRPLIMFESFGFTDRGEVGIKVSELHLSPAKEGPEADKRLMGFFLSTEEALLQVFADVERQPGQCILENPKLKQLLHLSEVDGPGGTFDKMFPITSPGEYSLFFINCQAHIQVSMNVQTAMYNLEGPGGSIRDYLPAGQTQLPALYFTFSIVYIGLLSAWVYFCVKHKETTHRIHILMGVLLLLKVLNMLAEAEDKSYVKKTGTAHGWDVLFYISSFLKGVMLFTVIVLVGTGWSFLKPYLQDKEKKVLMVVIPLQVFSNVAAIVIDETGPATKDWFTWRQLFLLLDIICCCAILFPIVWSIKHLREASHTDGKAARNLVKLTLFRHYYIVVVSYIYFTRIVVFALTTITPYQYRWSSSFAAEVATLAFYVFTGYKFRPVVHNPYFVLDEEEEEAAQEALKDDDFDL